MAYRVHRNEALDVTRIEYGGDLDFDAVLDGVRAARKLPAHTFRTLMVVLPETTIDLSNWDIRHVAQALRDERPGDAPHGLTAIVAPSNFAFGLARMAQVFMEDNPADVRVFHSEDDALEWLAS